MNRRTERPSKVDGAGELAQHSAARCSAPEINGPVVQQKFTSLLRETCSPSHRALRRWPDQEARKAHCPRRIVQEHRKEWLGQIIGRWPQEECDQRIKLLASAGKEHPPPWTLHRQSSRVTSMADNTI